MEPPHVLFVEDDDDDFALMKMALEECLPSLRVSRLSDGEQAVQFFQEATHLRLPDLVFLDLNLPRVDGLHVLQFIRAHASSSRIPIIMFTSSANVADRKRALGFGAHDFITKPSNLDQIMAVLTDCCVKYLGNRTDASHPL